MTGVPKSVREEMIEAAWLLIAERGLEGMSTREAMTIGTAGFTAMLCVMALERGASVFRVHDVADVADALKVAAATLLRVPSATPTPTSNPARR